MRVDLEVWDRQTLGHQETVIGRVKASGAPVGGSGEHDRPDLRRMDERAHVRLVHPEANGGARLLRRGYSYADDLLGPYVTHTSSGVYAVPPGVVEGGFWGEGLLG
ncbi:Dyp-type peroxidase domain-containing protein [Actinocorallia sp. A-T 12471]|uniref:Dyp-type peroxidase domain-containing protein n=1 Tax=Actinocorallia sp. A-T 12471 TaxID=3089813 RepID=UPI0029D342B1|nr:Dyp-type peroxidase domain-containing protein [Actinocorallia sp. A-T 12471]MDX6738936.1 Dyp-type peroxidase [Actinocorallia sp. A-T 12471]